MLRKDPAVASGSEYAEIGLEEPDDETLDRLIAAQRDALAESERAFVQARDRFDRQRKRLRELESERERRRLAAAGVVPEPAVEQRPRRKRSTTGMDALLGRDGVNPNQTFDKFKLYSLQRQEILLSPTGDRENQVLAFTDRDTGTLLEAHTFGEARRFHEQKHVLGRPGIPLQRQAIWYIGEGKAGWSRLDQLFVEQDLEAD